MTRSADAHGFERVSNGWPRFGGTALLAGALALLAGCSDDDTGSGFEPGTGMGGTMPLGGSGGTGTGGTAGMAGIGGAGGVGGAMVGGNGGVGGMLDAGVAGFGGADAGVDAGPRGGMGGSGGAETGIFAGPAFEPQGEPIDAPDGEWTWVPFPESRCRDDSPAGIDVNFNSESSNVMIYLEGGGACFDSGTCGSNPDSVGSQSGGSSGVFDRGNPDNPVADWNYVYVPYCTGDVHIGAQPDGTVEGVSGEQQFVGRLNLEKFLHRLVPTFADAEQVLLTGISAGGFGAASNSTFVQWAFDDIPVSVIDDSGPIFSEEFLPSCLNDRYRTTWNLDESVLADCGDACNADEDWPVQALEYGAKHTHPNARFGIIEFDADGVIRGFYGVGTNLGADDCNGVLLFTPMAEDRFLDGLLDLRERVDPYEGFSTYYIPGTGHTIIGGGGFYSRSVGGVSLVDWFQGILDDAEDSHIGP